MFVVCLVGDGEGEKEEGKGGGERRSCRRAEEEDAEDPKKTQKNFQGLRPNGSARNLQLWRVLRERNSQPLISNHKQIMSLKTTSKKLVRLSFRNTKPENEEWRHYTCQNSI